VFSNNTAQPYPASPEDARRLLGDHMLRPVDFVGEILAMHRAGIRTFVEVGPRPILTGMVAATLKGRPFQALALDASAGAQPGLADLARGVHLAALGFPVRLENWESPEPPAEEPRMRIPIAGANFRNPAAPRPGELGRRQPMSFRTPRRPKLPGECCRPSRHLRRCPVKFHPLAKKPWR
jgi:acyl transferase domain-containing protein